MDVLFLIKPEVQDRCGKTVTQIVYPDRRQKFFRDVRVCTGKEPLEFPLHPPGCVWIAIRGGKEILAVRKGNIPQSGISPRHGAHIIGHNHHTAFLHLGIQNLDFSSIQIHTLLFQRSALVWTQATSIGQPEVDAEKNGPKRILGVLVRINFSENRRKLTVREDVWDKDRAAGCEAVRQNIRRFSH